MSSFKHADSRNLESYLATTCSVDELHKMLREYVGVLNGEVEAVQLAQEKTTPFPPPGEHTEENAGSESSQSGKEIMKKIPLEEVKKLNEIIPDLMELIKKAGIRRICYRPHNIKSGNYSFVVPFGEAVKIEDKDHSVELGQLIRIGTTDEPRQWEEFPPMLLMPIKDLPPQGKVRLEIFPQIITEGITNRHIAFLDMMATASGYLFHDFHTSNAGTLYNGLPMILDEGSIASHAHELSMPKEWERRLKRPDDNLFLGTNMRLSQGRRRWAGKKGYEHYIEFPAFEGSQVEFRKADGGIKVHIGPRELADDWRGWLQTLGLNDAQLQGFTVKEPQEYYFPNRTGEYSIPAEVKRNFGAMVLLAQALNQKIHELYEKHETLPRTWGKEDRDALKAYEALRQQITRENRAIIAPLYFDAQKKHVETFGMKHEVIGDALTDERLESYDAFVRKFKPDGSEIVKMLKKRPDADPQLMHEALLSAPDQPVKNFLNSVDQGLDQAYRENGNKR